MYKLTRKGKDFVEHRQQLDLESIKERKENRKKWIERLITAGISIAVSVIVFTLGNYIKEGNIQGKPTVVRDTVVIQYVPNLKK